MSDCAVDGCEQPHEAKGFCGKHYMRFKRHGDPLAAKFDGGAGPAAERFWRKVDKTSSCWLWTGATTKDYGVFWDSVRLVYAHRWSFEAAGGVIPDGLVIDHLCRTPRCVNPAHLEPVTRAENTERGARWGVATAPNLASLAPTQPDPVQTIPA
jgi:hypothetical protein